MDPAVNFYLPPELFELLGWSRATIALLIVAFTLYFYIAQYREMTLRWSLTRSEAIGELRKRGRLAFGTLIAFSGEFIISVYVAVSRYIENIGSDPREFTILFIIPVAGALIEVFGGACIVRALIPKEWGRLGYVLSLGTVVLVLVGSRLFR